MAGVDTLSLHLCLCMFVCIGGSVKRLFVVYFVDVHVFLFVRCTGYFLMVLLVCLSYIVMKSQSFQGKL